MRRGTSWKEALSDREIRWLTMHFKHTRNDDIQAQLGISFSTLHRIARELGLRKSPQFMRKCQEHATGRAKESHLRNGTYPPKGYVIPGSEKYRFKAGESNNDRLSGKRLKEMYRRMGESRREIFRKERRRVLFGLEQKTRLKVVACPREKTCLRYNLRRHGYEVDRGANEAYITECTRRSPVMEARAEKMGMSFIVS